MKRRKRYSYFRKIRTTAERRANSDPETKKYVRGKRLPANLPSDWDDIHYSSSGKSWKDYRKTQYRTGKRGKEHSIEIRYAWSVWKIGEYFEAQDIPYRIERIYNTTYYWEYGRWQRVFLRYEERQLVDGYTYWRPIFDEKWVEYKKPKRKKRSRYKGDKVTWWSDKDVGIEYILNSLRLK